MNVAPELMNNKTINDKPISTARQQSFGPSASLHSPPATPPTSFTNANMRNEIDVDAAAESLDDMPRAPGPSTLAYPTHDTPHDPTADERDTESDDRPSNLCHPEYLTVPLEMLLDDSHDIPRTLHDTAEAYTLLALRLRTEARALQRDGASYPALDAIRKRAGDLAHLLHVHSRLALSKELEPILKYEIGGSVPLDSGRLAEDEIRNAEDSVTVCHCAMRVVSDIMAFWRLYQLFSDDDLCLLMNDLCDIILARKLYIVKARQTCAIAVWALYAQNLPWDVLATQKNQLACAFGRAIRGEVGLSMTISDGCKAFHKFSKLHPALFLPEFELQFPTVLRYLRSSSPERRLYAAHALAGFALGKLSSGLALSGACTALHTCIADKPADPTFPTFQSTLEAACKQLGPTHCGDGPIFGTVVVLALILISGPALFAHPASVQLIVAVAVAASTHGRSSARKLGARVWRALAWAAAQASAGTRERTRERLWRLVAQELRFGAGAGVVAGMLMSGVGEDVGRAVGMVETMLAHKEDAVREEAAGALVRMLGAGVKAEEGTVGMDGLVDKEMLEGGVLFTPYTRLTALATGLKGFDMGLVRALGEGEVLAYWDRPAGCWERVAKAGLAHEQDVLDAWQNLLLSQAHLSQGMGHLTAPPAHVEDITRRIVAFVDVEKDKEGADDDKRVDEQVKQLHLIASLYSVVRNVYSAPWLLRVARAVLNAVFDAGCRVSDGRVRVALARCVAALVASGHRELVKHVFETWKVDALLGRAIWTEVARGCTGGRPAGERPAIAGSPSFSCVGWQDLAYFLSLPLNGWCMDGEESEGWVDLLQVAAQKAGVESTIMVAEIFELVDRAEDLWIDSFLSNPRLILAVLNHIDLSLPVEVNVLLEAMDTILHRMYPPTEDTMATCQAMLDKMTRIVQEAAPAIIVSVLTAMNRSLCRWLENTDEAISDEDYNGHLIALYAAALTRLASSLTSEDILQPSTDTSRTLTDILHALSDFFSSVFYAPFPGDGPMHFEAFWRKTYHGDASFYPHISERLGNCLAALDQCEGGSLGQGLSQSQSVRTGAQKESQISPKRRSQEDPCFPAELASAFRTDSSPMRSPRRSERQQRSAQPFGTLSTSDHPRLPTGMARRVSGHAQKRKASVGLSPCTPKRRRRVSLKGGDEQTLGAADVKSESPASALKRKRLAGDEMDTSEEAPTTPSPTRRTNRLVLDAVEVPTMMQVRRDERRDSLRSSQEDYDEWERGVGTQGQHTSYEKEEEEEEEDDEVLPSDEEELAEVTRLRSSMPPPSQPVPRPQLEDRSQTEPVLSQVHRQEAPSLRRAATEGGSSAKLAALRQAHSAIMSSDSQTPTEDLMEAQQLAIQIQAELNERLKKQLRGRRR
ncbi:uncharacterized protein SCHCODRAFT_02685816 [Schizophyllum commune H4-8]|nr:uncharacterized protein SCHCODRAFT_02685816 [Schizophyllum commune H4-8]KAI5896907.1 hypothetical protein SCHCODRAFT_02685816 [Schizophyllum commune H4-8]